MFGSAAEARRTVVCGPKVLQRALAIFRALFQQGVGNSLRYGKPTTPQLRRGAVGLWLSRP